MNAVEARARRYMPAALFDVLGALVTMDGSGDRFGITDVSGHNDYFNFYYLKALLERGWVCKPYAGLFQITERGRIAWAIEQGRIVKRREQRAYLDRLMRMDEAA